MKLALILLMSLTALSARAADVAGHYVLHGEMEVGSELMLKPDGNFEFMMAYGAADYWAKGTWRQDGGKVILQSVGKEEEPFRLLRSEAGKPGSIRIWVIGQNKKGVDNIDVHLIVGEHTLDGHTDSDGVATFPDDPQAHAVAFEVPVYQVATKPVELDHGKNNFYFEINGDAITQVRFKDESLGIDGTTLVMTHWGADHPLHYQKE